MAPLSVNYFGAVTDILGLSTAARAYIYALHEVGVRVNVVDLTVNHTNRDSLIDSLIGEYDDNAPNIFNWLPDYLLALKPFFKRTIAQVVWETDRLPPQWTDILHGVKEVWVPCTHNYDVVTQDLKQHPFILPHPVSLDLETTHVDQTTMPALPDSTFLFYSVLLWQERKNPIGILRAFIKAFTPDDDVALILKVRHRSIARATIGKLLERLIHRHPVAQKIHIIDDDWTEEQLRALRARGNCYLSFHRGEGWCYPLFDAACLGTPVLATGYSGPLDYLDPNLHGLVPYHMVPVMQDYPAYDFDMEWADPDLDVAVDYMRSMVRHPAEYVARAKAGSQILRDRYCLKSVGNLAMERLQSIFG